MIRANIETIVSWTNGVLQGDGALTIHGVSTDSRNLSSEQLFIPLVGEKFDAHSFAQQVKDQGVQCMLWQADHPLPSQEHRPGTIIVVDDTLQALQQMAKAYRDTLSCKVIGVTGSNGKTSTKDLLATLLASNFKVQKTQGNLNNHIGLPLMLLQLSADTEVAVLEMGMSAAGEIDFLASIASPHYGVITNIGEAHIEFLGSRKAIAEAKFELIERLPEDGEAFLLGDEPLLRSLTERVKTNVTWFGLSEQNDIFPRVLNSRGLLGTEFQLDDSSVPYFLPVPGLHQVTNSLAAIAVARKMGCTDEQCSQALARAEISGMRLKVLPGFLGGYVINDAYNASPTSMKAALDTLASLQIEGLSVAVLGDMLELGENAADYHYQVGHHAAVVGVDLLVIVGKYAAEVKKGALDGGMKPAWVQAFDDTDTAARWMLDYLARTQDPVILVKGSRGMKMERIAQKLIVQE